MTNSKIPSLRTTSPQLLVLGQRNSGLKLDIKKPYNGIENLRVDQTDWELHFPVITQQKTIALTDS